MEEQDVDDPRAEVQMERHTDIYRALWPTISI